MAVTLPDFRNMGVLLRCGLIAEGARTAAVLAMAEGGVADSLMAVVNGGGVYESVLLTALFSLFLLAPALRRLSYGAGCAAVVGGCLVATLGWQAALSHPQGTHWWRPILLALSVPVLILGYFNWRQRLLSPALAEARLMALQARIRPHFLFNSLNTVLGLIRIEPRRAEGVLENLAELYRALLAEPGTLVPLGRELELARAYAEIETMRLGPRLVVNWQCQGAPLDVQVPPLIIQPLLENAVYHGVEPSERGGTVNVTIFQKGEQLNLVVRNPCEAKAERRSGNRMALSNIRERLALHFDAEAEMSAYESGGEFVVQIRMPCRHG